MRFHARAEGLAVKLFAAIDPGRRKCGVAVMDGAGRTLEKTILRRDVFEEGMKELLSRHAGVEAFAVGSGTAGGEVAALLRKIIPGVEIVFVEEKDTTRLAKEIFFRENPKKRYLGVFPFSLFLTQPEVDAYAAVAIGKRFLRGG